MTTFSRDFTHIRVYESSEGARFLLHSTRAGPATPFSSCRSGIEVREHAQFLSNSRENRLSHYSLRLTFSQSRNSDGCSGLGQGQTARPGRSGLVSWW